MNFSGKSLKEGTEIKVTDIIRLPFDNFEINEKKGYMQKDEINMWLKKFGEKPLKN